MKRFTFTTYGETVTEFGDTRSKARYRLFLKWRDAFDGTFRVTRGTGKTGGYVVEISGPMPARLLLASEGQ